MKLPFVLSVALVLLSGCATPTSSLTPLEERAAQRQGETLRTAKAQAEKLAHGMTREQVTELLGKPDQVDGLMLGADTPAGPWPAIRWSYYYQQGLYAPFIMVHGLTLYYQQTSGHEWQLNSWNWQSVAAK